MFVAVGWRDRDWGKFDDDEWESFVAAPVRTTRRTNRTATATSLVMAAVSLSSVATFLLHHKAARHVAARQPPPVTNVVGVRWRDTDLAPAASAGRICVTTETRGQVCAAYAIGEKPADALTRQLQALGLSVRSSR